MATRFSWNLVYAHDENGRRTSGDLRRLIRAVRDGGAVKFGLAASPDGQQIRNADSVYLSDGQVVAQSLWAVHNDAVGTGRKFRADPGFWMLSASTSGEYHAANWNLEDQAFAPSPAYLRYAMRWYVEEEVELSPWHFVYSHDENGRRIGGSLRRLIDAEETGHPIRVQLTDDTGRRSHWPTEDTRVSDGVVWAVHPVGRNVTSDGGSGWRWPNRLREVHRMTNTLGERHVAVYPPGADMAESNDVQHFPMRWYAG